MRCIKNACPSILNPTNRIIKVAAGYYFFLTCIGFIFWSQIVHKRLFQMAMILIELFIMSFYYFPGGR